MLLSANHVDPMGIKGEDYTKHWDILRMTPFSYFMDLEPKTQKRTILDTLIQVFDERTKRFKLCESYLQFRPEGVALVLGLRCDGGAIEFKRKKE